MAGKKTILITGGLGFIGHHLVGGVLERTDWNVVVIDKYTYAGIFDRIADLNCWQREKHRLKMVYHDLSAPIDQITHSLIGKVDYVWHLAAESHIDHSLENPMPFALSNVVGTTNLLVYIKKFQPNVEQFIQFSTDEVYGHAPQGVFYKEGDPMRPSNPYAASKAGADMMSYAFAHSFDMPVIIVRCMNVFGERQHPEKFIPKTMRSLLKGEPVIIHGRPDKISSRKWIHGRDVFDALLFLTLKEAKDTPNKQIYHLAGEEHNVVEMAKIIARIMQRPLNLKYVDARPGQDFGYGLEDNNLKNLGWKKSVNFQEALEKMVRWTLKNPKWLGLSDNYEI